MGCPVSFHPQMKSPDFLFSMHIALTCIWELQCFAMELAYVSQGKLHINLESDRLHPTIWILSYSGRGWHRKFEARHKQLTRRVAAKLNKQQGKIKREDLAEWFDEAHRQITVDWKRNGDPDLLKDPTRIFNCDESGFALDGQTGKKTKYALSYLCLTEN